MLQYARNTCALRCSGSPLPELAQPHFPLSHAFPCQVPLALGIEVAVDWTAVGSLCEYLLALAS